MVVRYKTCGKVSEYLWADGGLMEKPEQKVETWLVFGTDPKLGLLMHNGKCIGQAMDRIEDVAKRLVPTEQKRATTAGNAEE